MEDQGAAGLVVVASIAAYRPGIVLGDRRHSVEVVVVVVVVYPEAGAGDEGPGPAVPVHHQGEAFVVGEGTGVATHGPNVVFGGCRHGVKLAISGVWRVRAGNAGPGFAVPMHDQRLSPG